MNTTLPYHVQLIYFPPPMRSYYKNALPAMLSPHFMALVYLSSQSLMITSLLSCDH